ncbi:MAG: hypothetical protein IJM54_03780 [Thermoguttaceae bacterium]|nr:hypothetical protein [Thermoguttaceae bacterium]
MSERIMTRLASETSGKSYKAFKYSLDKSDRPRVDYDDHQIQWKSYGETEHLTQYRPLEKRARELQDSNESLFTYFLDGSRRVYKVDDIAYNLGHNRTAIYPVIAGQIGVACTKRSNKRISIEGIDQEIVISVPDMADKDGRNGYSRYLAQKINDLPILRNTNVRVDEIIIYNTGKDEEKYTDKGVARIQERMMKKETEMVVKLVKEGKLGHENYLIKDGSLEYRLTSQNQSEKERMNFRKNYNWVIGVSKSFNPDVCLDIKGHANPRFIADLPLFHRTPVSKYSNQQWFGDTEFAVWYIRIREQNRTRTAFDGIVKVEKILVKEKEINHGMDTDDVDTISANIINERVPVCYGSDLRWANHLYPIFLTESYLKSKYMSAESFLHLF